MVVCTQITVSLVPPRFKQRQREKLRPIIGANTLGSHGLCSRQGKDLWSDSCLFHYGHGNIALGFRRHKIIILMVPQLVSTIREPVNDINCDMLLAFILPVLRK
jgi:hypothetical protein